jgi:predicted transcriptional regulator
MLLSDYIKEQGVTKVSRMLNISQSAVSSWAALRSVPSDLQKYKINQMTHGLVSYDEMLEPYIENGLKVGFIEPEELETNSGTL